MRNACFSLIIKSSQRCLKVLGFILEELSLTKLPMFWKGFFYRNYLTSNMHI